MTQEILIIWLSESKKAYQIQKMLSRNLDVTLDDIQLITIKSKNDRKKFKKQLKKNLLKSAGNYAKFHETLVDPREILHNYGFQNYLLRY